VTISCVSQQDAFTDRELVGFSVTTADPACAAWYGHCATQFTVDLSDPADRALFQASDFTVKRNPADNVTLLNGNATLQFDFNTVTVVQGENTMHIEPCNSPGLE